MSHNDNKTPLHGSVTHSASRRPQRRRGPGLCRVALCAILSVAAFAVAPRAADAGDITYTWVEDDGKTGVSGSLVVSDTVASAGQITFGDVVSFQFVDPKASYGTSDLTANYFPISISTTDFGPTVNTILETQFPGLDVHFDQNWATPSGERWLQLDSQAHPAGGGYGHWTITAAMSTPEPSSLVLAGFAAVGGLVYGWRRKRGQRPAVQPV